MSIEVVVGINWGDEGKGRMIDYLAQNADAVVRYQGGNNAGHTVINSHGTFKLHLIPSGIFSTSAVNIVGPGTVINLEALCKEIDELEAAGISTKSLRVSDRATICFPFHQMEDVWEEERLGKAAYGSTRQGIAPAYGDRYLKKTLQVGELLDSEHLKSRLVSIVDWKNTVALGIYGKKDAIKVADVMDWCTKWGEKLRPYICDTTQVLEDLAADGKRILFEAQLGALRDVIHGIYPMTTSSSTLAGYACVGGGLFRHAPTRVMGVMKAFSTCVGAGPFVSEDTTAWGDDLRKSAGEFGATTGRPRRIGHFDAVASRYGALIQGATEVAITKLDSLSGQKTLRICTHYEVDGEKITTFPLTHKLERAKPVYMDMPGWSEDISTCRTWDSLPKAAQDYVLTIEKLIACPISIVSVGPERDSLITRSVSGKKAAA
ncbi:MAG: adenylosuccinate synthase [Proteobacteria bacterium]|nr:adenylosuccinate synthase [Pseudomonadota bacterium]